jgi:hypothetical protein
MSYTSSFLFILLEYIYTYVACGANQFSANGVNCSTTTLCDKGKYASVQPTVSSDRVCTSCPKGSYMNATSHTLTACVTCPSSQIQPLEGLSECVGCDDGYFKVSSSSQSPCLAGSFCVGCISTLCLMGTYQDSTQQSSCLDCPTTLFNPKTGQPSCSPCSTGSYRVSASQQQMCEAGYRCPGQCSRVVCGPGTECEYEI